ncbi:oligoendopeptidase F [Hazenella coriacea]|uniref:Oligopeptidase F n=1 Tax=Hazenella coriacea TaxID=1179467 RepID=A0A4R3L3E8_9BACL|nr:oligoendopeptidase F [Hazenella coriacea]TCS92183.1 oligopeptidase F [Hazenella coriacea]
MSEHNTKRLPLRSEVAPEYTWRLEDIFASDDLWEQELAEVKNQIPQLATFKGSLANSAEQLLAALTLRDKISHRIEKLYTYAHMRYDQDTTNSFYQGLNDRALNLYTEAASMMAYMTPEILQIEESKINKFLQSDEKLKVYEHEFEKLNLKRPHVLSDKEESLLAQASEVMGASSNTFGMLNNADLKFPTIKDGDGDEVEVTHGRFINFMESPSREVRQSAFKAMYETYDKYRNTFASTLSGVVKKNNFTARVRNYKSAREAALSNNYIPESVYDQLVETVNEHLALLHRYVNIRKRALGLSELHMYDIYTPLIDDVDMKVSYPEAQQILLKGLTTMGDEYIEILQEAYKNRWVDVYENKGKRSGAYSSGVYGTNPYILMNWQDNMDNLFTLAHEFGHSVHSYYTRKTQPYIYGDYSIFVAEVASTCNEALLNDYLLKTIDDPKKRLYLLNHYLESFRGTVFRQTMFAEFEHLIHQKAQNGEALTPDLLTSEYYTLNKKYYGQEIVNDEEIGLEWARIPHFYYNYYVYQYATGFSAATALSKQILEEGTPAVDRYLQFLKAGSSNYPIEVLKKAGVDMTSADPIRQALQVFEQKLNEFEQLLFAE